MDDNAPKKYRKKRASCCRTKNSPLGISALSGFLATIGEENRLKILCLLGKEEKCVCEIWQHLNLPQNLVSHHLKILKNQKLIVSRKEGLKIFYKPNEKNLKKNVFSLKKIIFGRKNRLIKKNEN